MVTVLACGSQFRCLDVDKERGRGSRGGWGGGGWWGAVGEDGKKKRPPTRMCDLVARTGRHQQRYENGCRLVAGCIPFRYKVSDGKKVIEVLMISSQSGPGLLFPKGGWENDETDEQAAVREAIEEAGVRGDIMGFLDHYDFYSKTLRDAYSPEGRCRAAMFALLVKEELPAWPEQSTRRRSWLTITEAMENCRHPWMQDALVNGFSKWHSENMILGSEGEHACADCYPPD